MPRREDGRVLIAQITDTHITCKGTQARYLTETIAWINAMEPRPDFVLLSGDTVNDGRPEQYAILAELLARCAVPVYVVPGNHDRRAAFRGVLPAAHFPDVSGERIHFALDTRPVRLIGLDTSEYRRPGAILDDAGLQWLETTLAAAPTRPTLIFMHHPPFRTGVNAADLFGFTGLTRFRRIIAQHSAVRQIIAGHIHCERRAQIAHAIAATSMSSAPQHVPELFERRILGVHAETPGFKTYAWQNEAFLATTYINTENGRFVVRRAG